MSTTLAVKEPSMARPAPPKRAMTPPFAGWPIMGLALCGLVLSSCEARPRTTTTTAAAVVPTGPALHQINNARLRALMDELNTLNLDGMAYDMKQGGPPDPQLQQVSRVAVSLAEDARVMTLSFRDAAMSSEARRVFDALALQFRDEVKALGDAANQHEVVEVQKRLQRVIATCNACHTAFRGPSIAWRLDNALPSRG